MTMIESLSRREVMGLFGLGVPTGLAGFSLGVQAPAAQSSIKGFGDSLNWVGSVGAALKPVNIEYSLCIVHNDPGKEPKRILKKTLILEQNQTALQVVEKFVESWSPQEEGHQATGVGAKVTFPRNAGLSRLHIIKGGMHGNGVMVPSTPIEVVAGLYLWASE